MIHKYLALPDRFSLNLLGLTFAAKISLQEH